MALTPQSIARELGLQISGTSTFEEGIPSAKSGIYFISLPKIQAKLEFDKAVIQNWIETATQMYLSEESLTVNTIIKELTRHHLPKEKIIYIGLAGSQSLQKRLRQFQKHVVGKKREHRGGFWLKTIVGYNSFIVDYIELEGYTSTRIKKIEERALRFFVENCDKTNFLGDVTLSLPFANLELNKRKRKKHQFKKQTS